MNKRFTNNEYIETIRDYRNVVDVATDSEDKGHQLMVVPYSDNDFRIEKRSHYYLSGPAVDRLKEYEDLGHSPEELKKIIDKQKYYKMLANCQYGGYGTFGAYRDSLDAFIDAKIASAITSTPSKIYISTSGDVDSPFMKKMKERANFFKKFDEKINVEKIFKEDPLGNIIEKCGEMLRKGYDAGLANPKPFNYHHKAMFKYSDTDALKNNCNKEKDMTPLKKYTVPKIERVLFNDPATIVFWDDGTKTAVRTQNGEPYDPEKGLAMAISKKALGNNREYYHVFLKHLKKYNKDKK